jgi:histidinol-phosphatase
LSYMMVAEGSVDLAAEPELELYDMAALDVIVREAGGRFSSLDGRDGPTGGNALATNGILHDTVLGFLGAVREDQVDRPAAPAAPAAPPVREGTLHDLSARRRPELPPL